MHVIMFSLNSHRKPQPAERETTRRKNLTKVTSKCLPGQLVNRKRHIWFPKSSLCYHVAIEINQ